MAMNDPLDPAAVLDDIAAAIPTALRDHLVVVGSIASAYAFRELVGIGAVRTKDADVVVQPAVRAVGIATRIANQLFDAGWEPRLLDPKLPPGDRHTPPDHLPSLRLHPPGHDDEGLRSWFLEFLGDPAKSQADAKKWVPFETRRGYFGLTCFRYMPIAIDEPQLLPSGLRIADPANLALAHLLEHAVPDERRMSQVFSGREVRRCSKDLGRAVALWVLAERADVNADDRWQATWARTLERHAGLGVPPASLQLARQGHAVLEQKGYLPEAYFVNELGVLANFGVTIDEFERAYARLGRILAAR